MSWSERQARMLQAMGLRLWSAPALADAGDTGNVGDAGNAADVAEPAATATLPSPAAAPAPTHAPTHAPVPAPVARPPAPRPDARPPVPQAVAAPAAAPAWAGAVDIGGMDWAALRQAVAGCRACGLCESRRQTVFGTGHPQAHWLIVGEAPGAEEDQRGEPFVGASGQLLDTMLHTLGLSRQADGDPAQRVFITNTLKCRPPSNRNPLPQETQQCAPFLHRQIELLQPRVILAMGKFAAAALLNNDAPLGQLRGQVHRLGTRPVIVTYHPSYLLRSPGEKAKAWADLCLAAATMEAARA